MDNLGRLIEAVIEENYLLLKTIQHIIELLDIENAMATSSEGNPQLDYLIGLINRERYDYETDTHLRDRLLNFIDNFLGGGTLTAHRHGIVTRFPTISSGVIKIHEPSNPYATADESYRPYFSEDMAYIERAPDQLGYAGSTTTRYYLDGAAPSGDFIWKKFKFVDASEFASYQLEIPDIYSSIVSGASGVIETINSDKIYTPFAGIWSTPTSGNRNGLYKFVEDEYRDFTVADLLEMEEMYAFPKSNEREFITYDITELIEMIKISVHYSMFDITETP